MIIFLYIIDELLSCNFSIKQKKMSDLINSCQEVAPFLTSCSFSRKSRFTIIDYGVNQDELVVKIYYDKDQFEHLIDSYVREMIDKIQKNREPLQGWLECS